MTAGTGEVKLSCRHVWKVFGADPGQFFTSQGRATEDRAATIQRIRGARLIGVLYILDEPSIGLHQRDNARLLRTLTHLRDLGNTVLVVEHDEDAIRTADHVVDIGPGAGIHGGNIIAQGNVDDLIDAPASWTGKYLSGELSVAIPERQSAVSQLRGARSQILGIRGGFEEGEGALGAELDVVVGHARCSL